jgi:predicted DNA-binding transcriptional regulator YafY
LKKKEKKKMPTDIKVFIAVSVIIAIIIGAAIVYIVKPKDIASVENSNTIEEYENGDFILTMKVPFERMWFSLLMGFGDKVQVLEPDELKAMLRQKAEEILSIY